MISESLRRLQDIPSQHQRLPSSNIDIMSQASTIQGRNYDHHIDERDKILLSTQASNKRFDTDEAYQVFLSDGRESRQSTTEQVQLMTTVPTAMLNVPSPVTLSSHGSTPNFIVEASSQRRRDESIERRVKEAKVNLEWKIALKLKASLGQAIEEKKEPISQSPPPNKLIRHYLKEESKSKSPPGR